MPFKWVKKSNRVPTSPARMKRAVEEVVEGGKLRTTANKYGIDKMTLRRYVSKYKEKGNETSFSPNFVCSQILDNEQEKAISEYLLTAARMNYGLTSKETRKLAYMYAVENKIKIPENWTKNETASYVWLRGFMLRNQDLSLRAPEPTSLGRATAFNKHTVGEFYELLRTVLNREQFGPECIFNCDETGVQTVHKPSKIISRKGQKQVSKATSGERGQTVTICCAVNAIGNSVPPVLIFPRVREQEYMTQGAPPGSIALTHPSGWMTAENFEAYLEHFTKFVKCSKKHKVLLILDNHSSHISPRGLNLCKDNGIVLLTIPPHTSHRLQPLDISVYGPFKTYYNQACDDFMVNHPGQLISLKDIAALVGVAHQRAFTAINIMKGFAKPGIFPFNAHIFSEDDFLSASVTDRPEPPRREYTPDPSVNEPQPGPSGLQQTPPNLATNGAQGSGLDEHTSELTTNEFAIDPQPSCFTKTPENIRPFPKAPPRKKRTLGRKQVKTKILTDTPNMKEIEDDYKNREQKNMKKINKVKRNISTTNEVKKPKPTKKKQEIIEDESESDFENILVDTSSEELTDIEDQMRNEIEEDNFVMGVINVNDYVLVRFTTDKTDSKTVIKHFVGKVLEIAENNEYFIDFMRRKKPAYHFVYPDVQDQSIASLEDIIKLPPPSYVGGTARASRKLKFSVKFEKYINVT